MKPSQFKPGKNFPRRRGVTVIWVAITGLMLVAFLGVATDAGYAYLVAHQLQNAADAAALAGARQLADTTQIDTAISLAQSQAMLTALNNKAGGLPVQLVANPDNTAGGDVVVGSYDRSTGIFSPNVYSPNAVQVTTRRTNGSPSGPLPLFFGPMFGVNSVELTHSAIAMVGGIIPAGLIILDPTDPSSLFLNDTSVNVTVNNGAVLVDSSSNSAVGWHAQPTVSATAAYIVGNDTDFASSGIFEGTDPKPVKLGVPYTPDPLELTPTPVKGPTQAGVGPNLQPGYYPNGLPAGNLVLASGIYFIDGGISLNGNTSINGSAGVFLYLNTGGISFNGGSGLNVAPMASGPYAGIAIMTARGNTSSISLGGNSGLFTTTGTLYFPSADISISGTPTIQAGQLIVNELSLSGNASMTINYNGNYPAQGYEVFLVQ